MEIRINIRKVHLFIILAFILIVGFAFAQTPPNPGHSASQVGPGTFAGSFTFDRTINVNQNGADFLSVTNTNPSQSHVALITNKNSFGAYSTTTSNWADFITNNIQASGNINSPIMQASNRFFIGPSVSQRVSLNVVFGGSGTCTARCGSEALCLGGWRMVTTFDVGSATCGDSSAIRCLCAGYNN